MAYMLHLDAGFLVTSEFGKLTGTYVLLNTSFNKNAEPIVETVDDAMQCFLTTGLDCLVVDDLIIEKRYEGLPLSEKMVLTQPRTMQLVRSRAEDAGAFTYALRRTVSCRPNPAQT